MTDKGNNVTLNRGTSFRADVEGLRALAVLSVVAFHFGIPGISGGFVGVDVFFVISGYLISGLLISELGRSDKIDIVRFYGRRIRRLLPASLLVVIVTLSVGTIILSPQEQIFAGKAAMSSSLYSSNFWFMTLVSDYFAPESSYNPFLHTWSLAVEEQFYIFWPAFLLVLWRFRKNSYALTLAISAAAIVSFSICIWLTFRKQPYAFYASPPRAWEFSLGALAVLPPVTQWARRSRLTEPLGWLGAVVLIGTFLYFTDQIRFPGWLALLPAAGTAAILISGVSETKKGPSLVLQQKPFVWIGGFSYSIYLWHWPIIVYASYLDPTRSTLTIGLCCLLTLLLAFISFYALEHPIRSSQWLAVRASRSVRMGVYLTLIGAGFSASAIFLAQRFLETPMQSQIAEWTLEQPAASGSGRGCLRGFNDANPVACVFGSDKPTRKIVLFGDSHADQWSTPLAKIAEQHGWQLITYLKSSCPVSDIPTYNMRLHRYLTECASFRAAAISEIVQSHPDLVIVTQFSSGYIQGPLSDLASYSVSYSEWADGLQKALKKLLKAQAPILLLRDTPTPHRNVSACVARAFWHQSLLSKCDTLASFALDNNVTKVEQEVAASLTSVRFGDLSGNFCRNGICPAFLEKLLVYRDANHLTTSFAAEQANSLSALTTLK